VCLTLPHSFVWSHISAAVIVVSSSNHRALRRGLSHQSDYWTPSLLSKELSAMPKACMADSGHL
jgi:hypothetical protein